MHMGGCVCIYIYKTYLCVVPLKVAVRKALDKLLPHLFC